MLTVADIIGLWPSAEHFAGDIGLKRPSHARVMKMRGRIPPQHWDAAVLAAEGRRLRLTRADLEAAHHSAPQPVVTPQPEGAAA